MHEKNHYFCTNSLQYGTFCVSPPLPTEDHRPALLEEVKPKKIGARSVPRLPVHTPMICFASDNRNKNGHVVFELSDTSTDSCFASSTPKNVDEGFSQAPLDDGRATLAQSADSVFSHESDLIESSISEQQISTNAPNRPRYPSTNVRIFSDGQRVRTLRRNFYSASMEKLDYRRIMTQPLLFPSTSQLTVDETDEKSENYKSEPDMRHSFIRRFSLRPKKSNAKLPPLTKRQLMTLAMMAFANFAATIVFSCIAPFFPAEAKLKGATATQIGLIFGIFELVIFIVAPIFGKYLSTIGPRFLFTVGLFTTGATSFLFGLLNFSKAGTTFIALSLIIRVFEALGEAAFETASFAIIANEFPGRLAITIGLLEMFTGLGQSAGPPIGGALYALGGFSTPFWTLGGLMVLAAVISIPLIPEQVEASRKQDEDEPSGGMLKLLRIPSVLLCFATIIIGSISMSFLDPTLSEDLKEYNLNAFVVGVIFLLSGGMYALSAPLWGWIVDKKGHAIWLLALGSGINFVAFLFVGPTPTFGLPKTLEVTCVCLLVMGLGFGAQLIPPFQCCLEAAKMKGYPDTFVTYGILSGLFQAALSFGSFIGPTVGDIIVVHIGFAWTSSIIALLNLTVGVAIVAYQLRLGSRESRWKTKLKSAESDADPLFEDSRLLAVNGETRTSLVDPKMHYCSI